MKIFRTKHSVCSECQVHFEPVTGADARWGNLCKIHREPIKARDLRRDAVVAWALVNWEKLERQMPKNEEDQRNLYSAAMRAQGGLGSVGAVFSAEREELTR